MELNSGNIFCKEEEEAKTCAEISVEESKREGKSTSLFGEDLEQKQETSLNKEFHNDEAVVLKGNTSGENNTSESVKKSSKTNLLFTGSDDIKIEQNIFSCNTSHDKVSCVYKRSNKTCRKSELYEDTPLLTKLVVKSIITQDLERVPQRKLYEIYPNSDELCDDCRWLVKATKSSESMKSSSDDDEMMKNWIESSKKLSAKSKESRLDRKMSAEVILKEPSKELVFKLLNDAHSSLLESNILLTTQKLHKKLRKTDKEGKVVSETSLDDVLFEQIQAEEGTKDGASKLCLVLERLATKYLKCCFSESKLA